MLTNHTHYKEIFSRVSLIISKFKEIITNVVFLGNFVLKVFAHSKSVHLILLYLIYFLECILYLLLIYPIILECIL